MSCALGDVVGLIGGRSRCEYGSGTADIVMGMVLIFVGLAGAAFNQDVQKEMKLGSTLQIGRYNLLLQSFESRPEKNYTAERISHRGVGAEQAEDDAVSRAAIFPTNEQSGTMVAIYSTLRDVCMSCTAGRVPTTRRP